MRILVTSEFFVYRFSENHPEVKIEHFSTSIVTNHVRDNTTVETAIAINLIAHGVGIMRYV